MHEDLVKRLRKLAKVYSICGNENTKEYRLAVEAADAIEELSRENESLAKSVNEASEILRKRWVPVTERLPECDLGEEVGNIEWISCGMVHAGCFGRGGKFRDAYFRTWTDGTEGIDAKDADYWRPIQIPEPPKDGE